MSDDPTRSFNGCDLRMIEAVAGMVANMAQAQMEVLRRITLCRAKNAEGLDLGGLQLTALDGMLLAALSPYQRPDTAIRTCRASIYCPQSNATRAVATH